MRNLKKVLSLVLCMAMMLSIMVVGAGAAFKDQSKIVNTEAVDACATLNIINGYTDGSFKPEGTITRAEACKMICVALNGGKEPVLGTNATASFTDIKGHWAEGYIEYCVAEGIVAGIGGGKFNPNGNVTGSQFAKMLLIALGYRADHEQFVGAAWEVNVNVKASQKDLYDELEGMDPSVALTRDNAAQMVWNALQAKEVAYEYTLATENGQLVSKVTVEDKTITLLKDKYDADIETGIVTGVGHNTKGYTASINTGKTVVQNGQTVAAAPLNLSKLADDPTDLVQKAVKVMYKAEDDVYGIYVDTDETLIVAEGYVADLDKLSASKYTVELDGTEYDTELVSNSVVVYNAIGGQNSWNTLSAVKNNGDLQASKIVLIDNDGDEKVDVAVVTPIAVAKVGTVDGKNIAMSKEFGPAVDELDTDDDTVYDGIKKDDYALYIPGTYVADGNAVVTKANVVSGEVTSTKSNKDIKVDGAWYTLLGNDTNEGLLTADVEIVVLGGNAVLVDTDGGNVSLSNLIYIQDAEKSSTLGSKDQLKAFAVKPDGKTEEIIVSKVGDTEITASNASDYEAEADSDISGKLYTYTISSGKYKLTEVTAAQTSYDFYATIAKKDAPGAIVAFDGKNAVNAATLTAKASGTTTNNQSLRIDDDATIFVYSSSDVETKVITGKALKAWKDQAWDITGVALVDGTSGYKYIQVAAITLNDEVPGAASDTMYGYIVSDVESIDTADGTKYQFTLSNGDTVTVTDKTGLEKDVFISYEKDGDDIDVTGTYTIAADASYIADIDGDEVMIGSTTYNMKDDETEVIFVRTKTHEAATGELVKADKDTAGNYYYNVIPVVSNNELKALFVDAGNKMYIDGVAQTTAVGIEK